MTQSENVRILTHPYLLDEVGGVCVYAAAFNHILLVPSVVPRQVRPDQGCQ